MRIARHHPGKQQLFVLLSLADLSLTWWLLTGTAGEVYESNPLARWWLEEYGWLGLAGFKGGMVLLVIGLTAFIARHSPRAGDRILTFASAALALVVLYSGSLCFPGLPTSDKRYVIGKVIEKTNLQARAEMKKLNAYQALRAETGEELVAGRLTLRDAVARLAASERGRDRSWLRVLNSLYGRPPRECLAADLIRNALHSQSEDSQASRPLAGRLGQAFEETFGRPLPPRFGTPPPSDQPEGVENSSPASATELDGQTTCARKTAAPSGSRPRAGLTHAV